MSSTITRTENRRAAAFPLWSFRFWRAYWITLRPYLMFLSGVSGLVGLAIGPELPLNLLIPVFTAFFLSYGLGQALTDIFQTDTDSISSPYRPLTQGIITGKQVLLVSLTGLALCGGAFFAANPWTLLLTVTCVAGLATYTPFKRRWWGGPFWNSWIVSVLPVVGWMTAAPLTTPLSAPPTLWAAAGSIFFSYAIFVLLGYFKDISADRATGYRTFPVVFGWKASVIASFGYLLGAILCSIYILQEAHWPVAGTIFWASGTLALAYSHWVMLKTKSEADAHFSIAHVVRGYVLMHLGEAVTLRPSLLLFALAYYISFEVVLALRPEPAQI